MRHVKVLAGLNAAIEEFGFALGEAQDFIDREEPHICDLIDDVAFGKLSSAEARQIIRDLFTKARTDVGVWAGLRATVAMDYGHPYLHPSLRGDRVETMPVGRVVVQLPTRDGAA